MMKGMKRDKKKLYLRHCIILSMDMSLQYVSNVKEVFCFGRCVYNFTYLVAHNLSINIVSGKKIYAKKIM